MSFSRRYNLHILLHETPAMNVVDIFLYYIYIIQQHQQRRLLNKNQE